MPATAGGWTTSVTGLAMATVRPNKSKGSWTHSRKGPIVNTPRRLVGNSRADEALVSEPIRSQRIRRPMSVANLTRSRAGAVEGRVRATPELQWSDGRSRLNGGRSAPPECDSCTWRAHEAPTGTRGGVTIKWISTPAARRARPSTTTGAITKGRATTTSTMRSVGSPVPTATASSMSATTATETPRQVGRTPSDSRATTRFVFRQCRSAARGGLAGHDFSSRFGRRPASRAPGGVSG